MQKHGVTIGEDIFRIHLYKIMDLCRYTCSNGKVFKFSFSGYFRKTFVVDVLATYMWVYPWLNYLKNYCFIVRSELYMLPECITPNESRVFNKLYLSFYKVYKLCVEIYFSHKITQYRFLGPRTWRRCGGRDISN